MHQVCARTGSDSLSLKMPPSYFTLLRYECGEIKRTDVHQTSKNALTLIWGLCDIWANNKRCTVFWANTKLWYQLIFPGTWAGFQTCEVLSQQNSVFCSPFAVIVQWVQMFFKTYFFLASRNSPPSKQRKFLQPQLIS